MKKRISLLLISGLILTATAHGVLNEKTPLRGADVGVSAGHCFVGPFGQTGDAEEYKGLCSSLTASERCLAYFKQHFNEKGEVSPAEDTAKVSFCSQVLTRKLD